MWSYVTSCRWRAIRDELSLTSFHGRGVLDELLGTSCPWRAFRDELFLTSYKGRAVLDELSGNSCPWRVIRNELSLTCYQGRAVLDELSGTSCPCRAIRDELSLTSYPCRVFNGKLYVTSCSSFCGLATAFKNWGIFGPYILYMRCRTFSTQLFKLKNREYLSLGKFYHKNVFFWKRIQCTLHFYFELCLYFYLLSLPPEK